MNSNFWNLLLKKNKGFSLIELLVVVAIIGILATVAVPSVSRFMAKAKQTEAKTTLTSIYTAEKAYQVEFSGFTNNFQLIGFKPEGKFTYHIGFDAANSTATCSGSGGTGFFDGCTIDVGNSCTTAAAAGGAGGTGFTAQARGCIGGASEDIWRIDQNKHLTNTQSGL